MSLESIIQEGVGYADLLSGIGRSVLNVKYPKEFELYMCALELLDQDSKTLRYFVFPVMPSSIEEIKPQITNIKKTLAGVTVLSNPTFIPGDISISGNFGRKFRVLIGKDYVDLTSSLDFTIKNKKKEQVFNAQMKTGYGVCKVLERIIDESKVVDEKGVRRLIFYNPALGNSYLVKPTNLKFSTSQESNMIWNYSLSFKTIASLESVQEALQLENRDQKLAITGYLQKQTNRAINSLTSILFQ